MVKKTTNCPHKISKFIASVVGVSLIGVIILFLIKKPFNTWYVYLNKPFFSPPDWMFTSVWTGIAILIGLSLFFAWEENFGRKKNLAIGIFIIQIILNISWFLVFFNLKNLLMAFFIDLILFIVLLFNTIVFYKINKTTGRLLIPYLLWVGYFTFVNLGLYVLN
ncbi:integral membrane protein [Thermosipho africanus TCF52B]|uniref:Integral membrane protein n=1 Tax=Thermosipho africanus (strain TCF52B) TaxID=484019 RepID=B7IEF7_THEAB|nr:TspO/MBR family protein [Thermosipho africanus]ACJ76384.1 integral membrane protein [Thermosipho africanus TCF52B]